MAEFKEVCKQWRRLCMSFDDKAAKNYRPCAELCPVGANPVCGELRESTQEDVEKFEAAIMSWAAENPEPVYPTWVEWLSKQDLVEIKEGQFVKRRIDAYEYESKTVVILNANAAKPIPADIAQKLGIEPKGD